MATKQLTLQDEASNVAENIVELSGKLVALSDWQATCLQGKAGQVTMELGHDLEDALASVRALKAAMGEDA